MKFQTNSRTHIWGLGIIILLGCFFGLVQSADAARLSVSPAAGAFPVGETFTIKIFIDTEGEEINALDLKMLFPADKVQLVSPNTSVSLIDVWASQPKFNNRSGQITLQGGIPNGARTSSGLITELTFRVRSTGQALIQFSSDSEVYLNDGKATPAGLDYQNAVFQLELPPPAGPVVTSATHLSGKWSTNSQIALTWFDAGDEGYSFVLDQSPVTEPDRVVDSRQAETFYEDVQAGVNFFHVRALRGGVWGGTTHYEIKIDDQPPADFDVTMFPSFRTSVSQPTVTFHTSDAHSGVEYYELNIIPLFPSAESTDQTSFIEVTSPYITHPLEPGPYEIVIRAHDAAGNVREVSQRFRIVKGLVTLSAGEGVIIRDVLTIPWWFFIILIILLFAFVVRELWLMRHLRQEHNRMEALSARKKRSSTKKQAKDLPKDISEDLSELKKYRKKYGHLVLFMACALGALLPQAALQAQVSVATPQIASWSRFVTNSEIFYLRGAADVRTQSVTVYVQDTQDGSLESFSVPVDEDGGWLYRHDDFLHPGEYALWVQGVAGQETSPPSAQYNLVVEREAVRLGATQLSLATLYLSVVVLLAFGMLVLFAYIRQRRKRLHKRRLRYMDEVKEAEAAVRHGFAILYKDLLAHLKEIKEKTAAGTLDSKDLAIEEAEILADLDKIQNKIGKEVADIEEMLRDDDRSGK